MNGSMILGLSNVIKVLRNGVEVIVLLEVLGIGRLLLRNMDLDIRVRVGVRALLHVESNHTGVQVYIERRIFQRQEIKISISHSHLQTYVPSTANIQDFEKLLFSREHFYYH